MAICFFVPVSRFSSSCKDTGHSRLEHPLNTAWLCLNLITSAKTYFQKRSCSSVPRSRVSANLFEEHNVTTTLTIPGIYILCPVLHWLRTGHRAINSLAIQPAMWVGQAQQGQRNPSGRPCCGTPLGCMGTGSAEGTRVWIRHGCHSPHMENAH